MVAALQQHDLAFYSTAAQILPVLVIVAIVELRYLPAETDRFPGTFRLRATTGYCGLATVAEILLLLGLATDGGSTLTSVLAMAALIVGIVMVFSAPIIAFDRARQRAEAKAQQDKENEI